MSYEHQVATIASWVEGLSSDNYALTSCQPRKIELPVMRTEACSGFLIESQGCVGVVGARSTLCKVNLHLKCRLEKKLTFNKFCIELGRRWFGCFIQYSHWIL